MDNIGYIPLSFMKGDKEIHKTITNTVIFKFVSNQYNNSRKIGDLLNKTQYGYNTSAKKSGKYKLIRITDIRNGLVDWENVPYCECNNENKYKLTSGDILIARTGGTTGKSYLIDNIPYNTVFASYLIRLKTNVNLLPEYLNLFLNSYFYWSQVMEMKGGAAQPNINAKKIRNIEIPYCPVEDQKKLVEYSKGKSIGVFFELSESIEKINNKLNLKSQLQKEITKQQTYIQKLRQQILQEAIQGKLTEEWRRQNPDVEPASELLKRIKAEKEQLVKKGKIKKQKPLPPVKEEEKPFELPEGWGWCRLGEISEKIGAGCTPLGGKANYVKQGIKFLRSQNIYNKGIILDDIVYISSETHKKMENTKVFPKDILLNITGGSIGRCAIVPDDFDEGNINQHVTIIRMVNKKLADYVHKLVLSPLYQKNIIDNQTGAGREGLPKNRLEKFTIPIPPISEQYVINERIEQLKISLSQLEEQTEKNSQYADKLMQAVLREAFEG